MVSGETPKPQSCNQAMNLSEVQGHFSWGVQLSPAPQVAHFFSHTTFGGLVQAIWSVRDLILSTMHIGPCVQARLQHSDQKSVATPTHLVCLWMVEITCVSTAAYSFFKYFPVCCQ